MRRTLDLFACLRAPGARAAAALLLALGAVIVAAGGCSSTSTTPRATPTPTPTASATATPTGATPTPPPNYYVSVSSTIPPTTDPTYGVVSGFGLLAAAPTTSPDSTPAPSQIITVSANKTIAFLNFDHGVMHTASLLNPATGALCASYPTSPCFPSTFNNTNGVVGLPAGTAITTPQFSTGTIGGSSGPATFSLMYSTGAVTGVFFFGDFFDYLSNPPVRTVIIVQ